MKTIATMIATGLALVLQGAFAGAQAVNANGHCTGMTVTDYVESDAEDTTTSEAWVNVTDGHLTFTTSSTGCVAITFAGNASASQSGNFEILHVRTLMDGHQLCVPAQTSDTFMEAINPSPNVAASITHVCKNLAAGAHTVQVQYSTTGDGVAQINGHVLTVTHN